VQPMLPHTSYTPDACDVSKAEPQSYHGGLHSEPTLLYRTGKEKWSPSSGPDAQCRSKELRKVFNHSITKVYSGSERGGCVVERDSAVRSREAADGGGLVGRSLV